jgi:hypothetical protein
LKVNAYALSPLRFQLRSSPQKGIFKAEETLMDIVDMEKPVHKADLRPNAVTLAAVQEARDIMSGKIKVEWNHPPATKEDLRAKLGEMGQDK